MSKEQLVKIDPKNLEYCSIELKSLLNKKLKDRDLKLEVNIYSDTNSPLNVEVEENSLNGATVCSGFIWYNTTDMVWNRKSSLLPLSAISMLDNNQLAKIKRWTTKYMEELATYYEEELKLKGE
jgi:hypothetical protein